MSTQTRSAELPSRAQALDWLRRWDDQQATFFTDREERFAVICDVLGHVISRPDPLVVDLGVGPGSLASRVLDRLPEAQIVGADMDPLLLGLGEAAYGERGLRLVHVDLREDDWLDRLRLDRAPDAFVSSTALHWLEREPLKRVVAGAAAALAPGGVFVDADHLYLGAGENDLDELARGVQDRAIERRSQPGEGWQEWWGQAAAAPELAALNRDRERTDLSHAVHDRPSVSDYLDALRAGGCREAGSVWQAGLDRIIVGLR